VEGFADQSLLVRLAIISMAFAVYAVIGFFVALAGYFLLGRRLAADVKRGSTAKGGLRYRLKQESGAVFVDIFAAFWTLTVPVYIVYVIWDRSIALVSHIIALWSTALNVPLKFAEERGYKSVNKPK
jgi:hypothetical protein